MLQAIIEGLSAFHASTVAPGKKYLGFEKHQNFSMEMFPSWLRTSDQKTIYM